MSCGRIAYFNLYHSGSVRNEEKIGSIFDDIENVISESEETPTIFERVEEGVEDDSNEHEEFVFED